MSHYKRHCHLYMALYANIHYWNYGLSPGAYEKMSV